MSNICYPSPVRGEGGAKPRMRVDQGERIPRMFLRPSPPALRDPLPQWERALICQQEHGLCL
jgi:hypothetical protein